MKEWCQLYYFYYYYYYFVGIKPVEQLRKSIQTEANRSKISIKVVERGGKTLRSLLQKSEIEKVKCQDNECVICETEDKGLCSKENVGYTVVCNTCAIEKKLEQNLKF